jgi:DNA invertase Pin-like site-specific DNA recombinase
MKTNQLRAAIYLRVSTKVQDETTQEPDLLERVKQDGAILKQEHIFRDKISGLKGKEDRVGLNNLLELTRDDIDIVYIWEISRLSRNPVDFDNILNSFRMKRMNVCFIKPNLLYLYDLKTGEEDLGTSIGLKIFSTYALYEIESKNARNKRGRKESIHTKGNSYTFKAPLGYKLEQKKLVLNSDIISDYEGFRTEVEVIKSIFDLYNKGYQLAKIIRLLEGRNIMSPTGKRWSKGSLKEIICNTVYYGVKTTKSRTKNYRTGHLEILTEEITINTPAIITEADYVLARKQAKLNKSEASKSYDRSYILRGILKCGFCGKNYIGDSSRGLYNYVCSDVKHLGDTKTGCKNTIIQTPKLDKMIWDSIEYYYILKMQEDTKSTNQENLLTKINDSIRIISNKEEIIKEISKKLSNLVDTITNTDNPSLRSDLEKKYIVLDNEKSQLGREIENLRREILLAESQIKAIENLNSDMIKVDTLTTNELKKEALKGLIDNVYVYKINSKYKVFRIKFKIGIAINVLYRVWRKDYLSIDDNLVTFNNPLNAPEEVRSRIPDFTVTSSNNELFNEDIFGDYSFDEVWKICEKYGVEIKSLKETT